MKKRTFTSRVITLIIIFSLISVGWVHAEAVCDGSCKCHLRGQRGQVHLGLSLFASGPLHRGLAIHLLKGSNHSAEIDFRDLGCHEGTRKLSCHMETPQDRYGLQRSVTVVSWAEHSSKADSFLFVSVIHPNEKHAPGPALTRQLIKMKVPDPLYMQHLYLLC